MAMAMAVAICWLLNAMGYMMGFLKVDEVFFGAFHQQMAQHKRIAIIY